MVSCARPTWRQTGRGVLEDDGGGEELVAPAAQRGELGAGLGEVARLVEEAAVADQHLVGAEHERARACGAATRWALSSASASAMSRGGAPSASIAGLDRGLVDRRRHDLERHAAPRRSAARARGAGGENQRAGVGAGGWSGACGTAFCRAAGAPRKPAGAAATATSEDSSG